VIFAALAALGGVAWPRGRAALHSAVVGTLTLGVQFSTLYWAAAQGVNVGLIALVIGTMPIVTALLGLIFLDERVHRLQWPGFALGFLGVALAVGEKAGFPQSGHGAAHGAGSDAYIAVLVGLLAISVGTLYQKRHASDVDPRSGLAVQHLAAAVALLPFAFHEGLRFDGSGAFFASLAWIIGVNSLSAFALFFVLLRRGAVNQVATLFFLMPPATAVMDYFVLGDALTPYKLAGLVLATLGVFLATRPPRSAAPAPQAAAQPRAPVPRRSVSERREAARRPCQAHGG
jgi:drug/metabolite transporter (DMT)-like permease